MSFKLFFYFLILPVNLTEIELLRKKYFLGGPMCCTMHYNQAYKPRRKGVLLFVNMTYYLPLSYSINFTSRDNC